eukprot:1378279-Amphidinium_carterae.1
MSLQCVHSCFSVMVLCVCKCIARAPGSVTYNVMYSHVQVSRLYFLSIRPMIKQCLSASMAPSYEAPKRYLFIPTPDYASSGKVRARVKAGAFAAKLATVEPPMEDAPLLPNPHAVPEQD